MGAAKVMALLLLLVVNADARLVIEKPEPVFGLNKMQLCDLDVDRSRFTLDLIKLKPEPRGGRIADQSESQIESRGYPRVLCIVNTISVHHSTRAQAVADTWGQRCDSLLFFSNASDTIQIGDRKFDVVALDVPADHNHLWQKHKATLRYVHERFRNDFDWFYKADDDAYVVVENLRAYLWRPEILMSFKKEPMQMGHRFNLTQELVSYYIVDERLERAWRNRWERWVFNSGGPGYAMNLQYLDKVVASFEDWTCLSDAFSEMLPDDASISFCMMWHNVYPWDTRDLQGRERWHADKPKGVYFKNPNIDLDPEYWYEQYHRMIGGVRWEKDGAAPDSVAFHYISPEVMYHIERWLYLCRAGDDVRNVADFNAKFDLRIGDKVMVYQDVPKKHHVEDPVE